MTKRKALAVNLTLRMDHISLNVRDLASAADFYGRVLGLPEIENKTRNPAIRWFGVDEWRAFHLITGPDEPPPKRVLRAHYAFSTPRFDDALKRLTDHGVTYYNVSAEPGKISIRADGVRQIYFQDPDNHWLEFCEANEDGTVG